MAKAIFDHLAKNSVAESGGTDLAEKIDPRARETLEKAGIPISNSTIPKEVTNEMIEEADLVISFGRLVPSLFRFKSNII